MGSWANKTVFITGGSRGIGREIILRLAREGANITIAAKSDQPNPKLPGTIHSVAQEAREAGATPCPLRPMYGMRSKSSEQYKPPCSSLGALICWSTMLASWVLPNWALLKPKNST